MPSPGPWVQPPDVDRIAARSVFGSNAPWTSSLVSVDSTSSMGDMLAKTTFTINDEDPAFADMGTSYDKGGGRWDAFVTLVRFDPQFVSLAPVPPTPAELAQPHVVGYEYEGGAGAQGVIGADAMPIRTYLGSGADDGWSFSGPLGTLDPSDVIEYRVYEAVEGVDFSLVPATVGGRPGQQVHTLVYPNQTVLGGRTVVATNHAGTFGLNDTPQGFAGGVEFVGSTSAPRTYIVAAYNLYSGIDLVLASTSIDYSPSFQVTVTVRPPRYRLLYDYVPQRQFPRDDGLGISTLRRYPQRTSKQFSQRKGPTGTYL